MMALHTQVDQNQAQDSVHRPKTGCQTHFPIANSAHDYKNTQNAHAPTQRTQRTHACVHARRDIRTDWHWGNTSGIPKKGPVSVGSIPPGQYLALQHAYPVWACVTENGNAWNPTGGEGGEGGQGARERHRTPEGSANDTIHEHVYITVDFIQISPGVRPDRDENVRCGRNTYRAHEESVSPGPTWTLETI